MYPDLKTEAQYRQELAGCWELIRLADEAMPALLKDAARYRHAKAHGWPMSGPQCVAWAHDGKMVFGDTPEAALDAAMQAR